MIRGADVVDQYVTAADAAEEKSNAEILSRCDCWHGTICRRGGERMKMMTVYNPLDFWLRRTIFPATQDVQP